ncbi:Y-family DNA polymerase [Chitinophaga lutea]
MSRRYVSIWFRYLLTDRFSIRRPDLRSKPFVLRASEHGRMVVAAVNAVARQQGITTGMPLADARALVPGLAVMDNPPELCDRLLKALGEWCIRYTPVTAVDPPEGLILDASGCAHLWGGEEAYLKDIVTRLRTAGYEVRAAMADTIGVAWAMARFREGYPIVPSGEQTTALLPLPPSALRLEAQTLIRMHKLGLLKIRQFISMPRAALRRRFGTQLLTRIDQALGLEAEIPVPLQPPELFQERLPCLEPILTATGISIALERLLEMLCTRLQQEGKGLRTGVFKCHRVDGAVVQISIGTTRPSQQPAHLFHLFALKIAQIEPDMGIELFVLEAPQVEDAIPSQDTMWSHTGGLEDPGVSELIDRLAGKLGPEVIRRYLPAEHYWPERSVKPASRLEEQPERPWETGRPRPVRLLRQPESIIVSAPIPDYPPMLFRYQGKVHAICKADGPERIEREWWLDGGDHRDYYCVEDEEGRRYWVFRSGHYDEENKDCWFIHGFFA